MSHDGNDGMKRPDNGGVRLRRDGVDETERRRRRRNPPKRAAPPLVRAGVLLANGPKGYVRLDDDGVVRFFGAGGQELVILGAVPREWVRRPPTHEAKETARQVLARRIPPTLPKKPKRGFVDRADTTGGNALGMRGRARGRG